MNNLQHFWQMVYKDIRLEWRMKHAIGGMLLYVISTVFIIYSSFIQLNPKEWNTTFWIVILFAALNANAKSFSTEPPERNLYYYSIVDPLSYILAKLIYNSLLLIILSGVTILVYFFFFGNPIREITLFVTALGCGSFGFSVVFTFISAISMQAKNSALLIPVLGFPLVLPLLMTLIKISASGLALLSDTSVWQDVGLIVAIDLVLVSLLIFLFPYIYKA